ncbi:MAG: hypothetical protein R2713_09645 [Ilumatobacteraceae bacterium]
MAASDAQANFVYLPLGAHRRGVPRPGASWCRHAPFTGEGIRATIGSEAENDRFLATLAGVAEPG